MFNLFAALKKDKLWDFKGGIHPPEMKHPSSHVPLRHVSLPPMLIIPVQQHIGPEGELLVKVGQHVMKVSRSRAAQVACCRFTLPLQG